SQIGAIILIPLHDDAAGHGGGLQGNDRIELPLANHHAARVLPEVTREILNLARQREKLRDQSVGGIEPGGLKLFFGRRFAGMRDLTLQFPSAASEELREAAQ